MSSKQFLIDAASRHAVFIQRYSAGLEQNARKEIKRLLDGVTGIIAQGGNLLQINAYISEFYGLFSLDILAEAESFAVQELEFSQEMMQAASKVEVVQGDLFVKDTLMNVEPQMSVTVNQALIQFSDRKKTEILRVLRDGITEGKTQMQQVADIRNLTDLQARQAGSLVRTINNAISSESRKKTIRENSDIFIGYQWVSTLDNRTSHICMARDGKVYDYNKGDPMPPAHWACRSTVIPVIDPKYDLGASIEGDRPSVGDEIESVGAKTTYGGWLRNQSAGFQDEALGKDRAKLFRRGGLKVEDFVDNSGRTYTLDELRQLRPLAFERAGLTRGEAAL